MLSKTNPPAPDGATVVNLHALVCDLCRSPIKRGETYANPRKPDGSCAAVHTVCMAKGSVRR